MKGLESVIPAALATPDRRTGEGGGRLNPLDRFPIAASRADGTAADRIVLHNPTPGATRLRCALETIDHSEIVDAPTTSARNVSTAGPLQSKDVMS